MKAKKMIVTVLLAAVVSVGAFASGSADSAPVYLSASVKGLGTPVMPLVVDPPAAIVDWFADHGLDTASVGTTLESMPVAYRNKIRSVYADNESELRAVAAAALKPYLQEGVVETVTTTYGPFSWTVSYGKEVDEDLYAPKDL
ncbi:hypothetical protein [Treponema brennaborense]|uniref:Lipoprotein n=1 Tax=Treponema brennaborense (strain DSM 12168 / CIP 105900 / DD5/3) TaxID=906968 RepID=F4LLD7_TREBD|nr:hypothetical protein [Treponema brennaborense]AEE15615.1 hypothetical protein Trebr_0164 [Treponema brennaborense DSM 12168]